MIKKKKITLVLFIIIFSLIFMNFILAECSWEEFGGSFTPLWNKQLSIDTCYGRFDEGFFETNFSYSSSNSTQPIVSSLGTNQAFLILYVGNFLNIYDKNLILITQKNLGSTPVMNPDVLNFFNPTSNDIATMVRFNETIYTLKVLTYNNNSGTLNISFQYNYTVGGRSSTFGSYFVDGLRHSNNNIKLVYTWNSSTGDSNYSIINSSGLVSEFEIPNTFGKGDPYTQPVAWWDMDGDSINEVLTYSQSNATIFSEADGSSKLVISCLNQVGGCKILDAHIFPSCHVSFFHLWESECHTEWKLAVLQEEDLASGEHLTMTAYNLDGSVYWTKDVPSFTTASANVNGGRFAIDDDYNGDGYADIFLASEKTTGNFLGFTVFSGLDGSTLATKNFTAFTSASNDNEFLTIADMNHDGKNDFIFVNRPHFWVYDIFNNNFIYNNTANLSGSLAKYCIPSDLNLDGFDEILCSSNTLFEEFSSNSTNQNANIVSVTFDPSTTLSVNVPLNIFITATDPESNLIRYYIKCSDTDSFNLTTATTSCLYTTIGSYNLSVGVKDFYHDDLNIFSQLITVTSSGDICGNSICGSGENSVNCPVDCPATQPSSNTTQSSNGGIAIPTKIVDTVNTDTGLLPTIYYSILAFLSNTLVPMMILVFMIFVVLIILAVGTIIKKIGNKIGG